MLLLPRETREFIVTQQNIKLSLASRKEHLFQIPKSLPLISEQIVLVCFLIEREFHMYSKHKDSEHCFHMGKHNVCYFLAEEQQHRSASSWQGAGRVGFISLNFIYKSIKHSIRLCFLEVTKGRKSSIHWRCLSSSLLTAAVAQMTSELKHVTHTGLGLQRETLLSLPTCFIFICPWTEMLTNRKWAPTSLELQP